MYKRISLSLLLAFSLLIGVNQVFAQNDIAKNQANILEISSSPADVVGGENGLELVPITILERADCAHCRDEKAFLEKLKIKRSDVVVYHVDIQTEEGRAKWIKLAEMEGLSKVTPLTLVGNRVIQGFDTDETTGKIIENLVDASKGKKTLNLDEFIEQGGSGGGAEKIVAASCGDSEDPFAPCGDTLEDGTSLVYTVPFFGKINLAEYSLISMSSILGLIDGFNPCAMWVLVTFLVILIQAGDKKKMWIIAGLFILAEAIMYYMILVFWMKTWDFVGLDKIVTPIVGLVAIGGGIFFLYEWRKSDGSCKVTDQKTRTKTINKINSLVQAELTIATILGVLLLAFSVNIIEFACSIGIPQAFTKILELNNLGFAKSQLYLSTYIFFYMVDDLIVFAIALWSFEKLGITTKYVKFSNLVGGILMLILGAILIIKPELLVFS